MCFVGPYPFWQELLKNGAIPVSRWMVELRFLGGVKYVFAQKKPIFAILIISKCYNYDHHNWYKRFTVFQLNLHLYWPNYVDLIPKLLWFFFCLLCSKGAKCWIRMLIAKKNIALTPEPIISRKSQLSSNVAALSHFILALNAPWRPQFKQQEYVEP